VFETVGTEIVFPDKCPPSGHWESGEYIAAVHKMSLFPCTKIYSALKRFFFIGTAAAVITAVVSVILSLIVLLMLISFLNILTVGVLILIPVSVNS
jgi:FlaA1/EpsC-like NDP-sugar epimerase